MLKPVLMIILIFSGFLIYAQNSDCNQLPQEWKSEKDAISRIENTQFTFSESVNIDQSSWMSSAYFYSCENDYGYLIIKGKKKTFIHEDVPVATWEALKNAKSIGGFYIFYIKDKYVFGKKGTETSL